MLAMPLSGCGKTQLFPQDGQRAPLQDLLRRASFGASPTTGAYWLGPEFHGARIQDAGGGDGNYDVNVDYGKGNSIGQATLLLSIVSYAGAAPKQPHPESRVRVRMQDGQDVVVSFFVPRTPSRALLREARAAIQPISHDVTYPGN
jgi:hypothetical protein